MKGGLTERERNTERERAKTETAHGVRGLRTLLSEFKHQIVVFICSILFCFVFEFVAWHLVGKENKVVKIIYALI